jgi:peptidoglycan/xylan/chitin deacetylase (PgdA/CDA1 family)
MIAVHAEEPERTVVAEFFELFKTPWEFFSEGSRAEVVICSRTKIPKTDARLLLIYSGEPFPFDAARRIHPSLQNPDTRLLYGGDKIPVYGSCLGFGHAADATLKNEISGESAIVESRVNGQRRIHIGYDLFQEVLHLLTRGQPAANAGIPALELHIALLRDLIVGALIPLVEIPPVPAGCNFIACLTHDVDHVGIKNHKFDHTMFGFLYRATLGSLRDVFRSRKTLHQLAANWLAALKLPLVHLGLARDFWYQFDHYVEIENGAASTFFVIPKKGETGLDAAGNRPAKRAASYDAAELAAQVRKLQSAGKEVGVHGIDAWRDATAGKSEHEIISRLTGTTGLGVRMHWLYFDEQSPAQLERAGFSYDSTVGYNDTVGYRAGTTQVYKPLTTTKLLELPMHIMDTALFYPSYLNLSPKSAQEKICPFVTAAARFGGALTVNWHDRSLAPERLWDGAYRRLLEECKAKGAWFATAAQTVAWFQKRRAVTFASAGDGRINIQAAGVSDCLPPLRARVFHPDQNGGRFVEHPLPAGGEICLAA